MYSDIDDDRAKAGKDHFADPYSSDSSGNGTRFANRTCIFSLDFPPSPKVPKGKGKKTRVMIQTPEPLTSDSDCTTILPTQTEELTVSAQHTTNSDSDVVIQPSGFVTECKKKQKRCLSRKKGSKITEAPVVSATMTKDVPNSVKDDNQKKEDEHLLIPEHRTGGQH